MQNHIISIYVIVNALK